MMTSSDLITSLVIKQSNKKATYSDICLVLHLGLLYPVHISAYIYCTSLSCTSLERTFTAQVFRPISGRVDRASATEAVDLGSIPGRVKPKTIKIGIHSFPA